MMKSKQKGSTLIIGLIMLIVIAVLAVTASRSSALQTRMSANHFEREVLFQAAENTLIHAEDQLARGLIDDDDIYGDADTKPDWVANWRDNAEVGALGVKAYVLAGQADITAQFFIEELRPISVSGGSTVLGEGGVGSSVDLQLFRITVRAMRNNGVVVLESIFAR